MNPGLQFLVVLDLVQFAVGQRSRPLQMGMALDKCELHIG